jgi:phosphatidylserine decarboxylase
VSATLRFLDAPEREQDINTESLITDFIRLYGIDMADFSPSDPADYESFQDFLLREFENGARPVCLPDGPAKAVMCADATARTFPNVVSAADTWFAKSSFNITNLVMDLSISAKFEDGSLAVFRLGPQHCHYFYSPVSGEIAEFRSVPSSPIRNAVNESGTNPRQCIVFSTIDFGDVLFVAIGNSDIDDVEYDVCKLLLNKRLTHDQNSRTLPHPWHTDRQGR